MRVGFRDLTAWSLLMSTAHGAGLMLVPVLMHLGPAIAVADPTMPMTHGPHAGHMVMASAATGYRAQA